MTSCRGCRAGPEPLGAVPGPLVTALTVEQHGERAAASRPPEIVLLTETWSVEGEKKDDVMGVLSPYRGWGS